MGFDAAFAKLLWRWRSGGFREGLMLGLAPLAFKLAPQFCLAPIDKINPLS